MMNQRSYNFSPGPAALPDKVIQRIQQDLFNWQNTGVSVMEMNHRHPLILQLRDYVQQSLRELLQIPEHYEILFCPAGGRGQYSMIPLNLLSKGQTADYIVTGLWSKMAAEQAKKWRSVRLPVDMSDSDFSYVAPFDTWSINPSARFVHYVDNETVHGIEFPYTPHNNYCPLVCDMTSSILTKPINVSDFSFIYAACQKNLGIAGLTLVVVDPSLLPNEGSSLPPLNDYRTYIQYRSMYNTPPTFSLYVTSLMLDWVCEQGGVDKMAQSSARKSSLLYDFIDNSSGYVNHVSPSARSRINIPFYINKPDLTETFVKEAEQAGLFGLRGHHTTGGLRVSLYNAVSEEAVMALIRFMKAFAWRYLNS